MNAGLPAWHNTATDRDLAAVRYWHLAAQAEDGDALLLDPPT